MGEKQVAIMLLKVDLQCHRCYKKIKKVLCKYPQIQDQVYDEKKNTVTIKVVCCSPEKIKEKIICKAGDTLKSIEIKVPEKPKEPEKPKKPEKPKEKPPPPPARDPETITVSGPVNEPQGSPPRQAQAAPPRLVQTAVPVPVPGPCLEGYPPPVNPYRVCCTDCFEGRPGGPCFYGCVPPGPPPCYQYDRYYRRPVCDSYGGSRAYYTSRCDYFSEENTVACSIM